jgi:hypothetical protein
MKNRSFGLTALLTLLAAAPASAALSEGFKEKLAASAPAPVAASSPIRSQRYDSDCVSVSFNATDAAASERFMLRSQEWVWECVNTGDPRRGGGRQCWERPGFSWSRVVRVERTELKPMLPWEKDSFQVCLQGPWLDSRPLRTSHKYRLVSDGRDGTIAYAPGEKLLTRPDPAGVTIASLSSAFTLTLSDRWADHYAGESIRLKITVKKDKIFSPTAGEFSVDLPAASSYRLDLAAKVKLEAGKGYFVKVEFQRPGKVSSDEAVSGGQSTTVKYQPSAQFVAGL